MAAVSDPLSCKETFLQENELLSEIELNNELKPIGRIDNIDLVENDIWLLQCPKDVNIIELQNEKLKIPGRSNINSSEVVSMEFNGNKESHAFAYFKKGRYCLRLLPVQGTIVLRDRLKAAENVTEERAEECVPSSKRVPMPKNMRVRHPLLGVQYKERVQLDKSIEERLQKADKKAAQILKQNIYQKNQSKSVIGFKKIVDERANSAAPIEIKSDDDAVEFVKEEKLKKKKRKHSEASVEANSAKAPKKSKKSTLIVNEIVSEDLQWLQTI